MATFFAFLHHFAAFSLAAALAIEFVLIRDELTVRNARKILFADLVLGISAATLLTAGTFRVLYFEKGLTYYMHSIPFIIKISLFLVLALLSARPTIEFLSWRKTLKQNQAPVTDARKIARIRSIIHLELAGIAAIILCAILTARGIGFYS